MNLVDEIRKISLKDGDVLLVRVPWELVDDAMTEIRASGFIDDFKKTGIQTMLIVAGPDATVESLDEEQMGEHGWVRKWNRKERIL